MLDQFVECLLRYGAGAFAVIEQVLEQNSPMGADFVVGQFTTFEQADQMGARDVEEVGGLLGGQRGMNRHGGILGFWTVGVDAYFPGGHFVSKKSCRSRAKLPKHSVTKS